MLLLYDAARVSRSLALEDKIKSFVHSRDAMTSQNDAKQLERNTHGLLFAGRAAEGMCGAPFIWKKNVTHDLGITLSVSDYSCRNARTIACNDCCDPLAMGQKVHLECVGIHPWNMTSTIV